MADALSAAVTAFSIKGARGRRTEEVRHASSLLRIAACRAALLLRVADNLKRREPDKTTALGSLLKELQEDLKARILKAEAMIRPYELESRLSFRQELGWKMMKKDFYAQLSTCERLSEGLAQCFKQRDSETLSSILGTLEKSAAVSQSHEELRVKIGSDRKLILIGSDDGLEKEVSKEPPPGQALAMMVRSMYKLAMEGLYYISRVTDPNFESLYESLKGWGLGLFEGTYDLTKMLTQNHVEGGQCSAFHIILISILVEIDAMIPAVTGSYFVLLSFSDTLRTFLGQEVEDARLQRVIHANRQILQKEIADEPDPGANWHAGRLEEKIQDLFLLLPVVEVMRDGYTPPEQTTGNNTHSVQEVNVGKAYKPFTMPDLWKADKSSDLFKANKSSDLFKANKASGLFKADKSSGLFAADKSSGLFKANKSSDLFKADESSGLFKANKSSDLFKADESSSLFKADNPFMGGLWKVDKPVTGDPWTSDKKYTADIQKDKTVTGNTWISDETYTADIQKDKPFTTDIWKSNTLFPADIQEDKLFTTDIWKADKPFEGDMGF